MRIILVSLALAACGTHKAGNASDTSGSGYGVNSGSAQVGLDIAPARQLQFQRELFEQLRALRSGARGEHDAAI